ncbi:MAG TPA: hypothetical protein VF647_07210 [Longimicrobium sp.]
MLDGVSATLATLIPVIVMELTHADLAGAMFTTLKELRHLAEQQYGQLFVPTEVLSKTTLRMVVELRLEALGRVVLHAERARHWQPYRVTRIENASEARVLRIAI